MQINFHLFYLLAKHFEATTGLSWKKFSDSLVMCAMGMGVGSYK